MKLINKSVPIVFLTLLLTVVVFAQNSKQVQKPPVEQPKIDYSKGLKPPRGPSFYIAPVVGSAGTFSVLLTDDGNNSVAGTFALQQLDVFEAVLEAAKAFALTDEKVGSGSPITTRLMDQHEWSFFVDVSKLGNLSRFYVTLVTLQGKVTVAAGEVTRGSKKELSGLLVDILTRVHEMKTSTKQPQ
jgi:hypothetical protein